MTKHFTVVIRAPAAVVLRQGEFFRLVDVPTPTAGKVTVKYGTRWLTKSINVIVPGDMWIEICGSGDRLEDVLVPFANAGISGLPTLSLVANAAIGMADIELGFESTAGISKREFFQRYIPAEHGVVHEGRSLNCAAAVAVFEAIAGHRDCERLLRAANQYQLALDSWKLGREMLSLAHLWMALEAITTVMRRDAIMRSGLKSNSELAHQLGVSIKELDATVRRKMLLDGDEECYEKAKAASDGFEHGYLGFDRIHDAAKDVRHRMASHIRGAILKLSGAEKSIVELLTRDPYDKPLGDWPLVKYVRGHLLGDSTQLARQGSAYPFLRWDPIVTSCKPKNNSAEVEIEFQENIIPELADGISIQLQSFEAWKPS